ncbi:MAG: hypothetical protein MGAcid_05570 [uncultured Acidilobus sp. MG]|nr:MAG: hypothetical protein MGAcid_05570 [uncultured Acidilobus sp. MG]ESQ26831.1 MAG: hypothetical protein OSP8Acid_01550 [uncultured Acidilobus sp. OSP8]
MVSSWKDVKRDVEVRPGSVDYRARAWPWSPWSTTSWLR